MALGEILRNAREQKGLTPSVVAESTHMKVQIVEDLEREDFRRIAAPIYGRGFVKLYAELLQLDPEPLVRDFMELYSGARVPAVRTKRIEAPCEQQQECVPIKRTVTGVSAAVPPLRQQVQAKPAVRPLSVPLAVSPEASERLIVTEERGSVGAEVPESDQAVEGGEADTVTGFATQPRALVVDPEETCSESDEPDLFRPNVQRRRPDLSEETSMDVDRTATENARAGRKCKLPVFKIGGRLEEKSVPSAQDDAASARRRARIDSFIDGFRNLKDGVERKLPARLPHKQMVALCGAAVSLLVFMAVGIGVLFKMTGSDVREKPGTAIERVAPPPDLYVD
jgi:cytoskeletal protein RodZ